METVEQLTDKLRALCEAGSRDQLIARGLARGMIWEDGTLPPESPNFSPLLTNDLLNHGYMVLGCAIRLRSLSLTQPIPDAGLLDDGFRTAAECIEAVARRGESRPDRGFHLTIAAAAFHLGHYGARSFSLLAENAAELNLVDAELLLVALMRRRLGELQTLCRDWLVESAHTDAQIAAALESEEIDFDATDAAYLAINRVLHRAVANFDFALRTGDTQYRDTAIALLDQCIDAAAQLSHVPLWWISILARHLIDDLWQRSLHQTLPRLPGDDSRWPELRRNFIELLRQRSVAEIDLWPSQVEAAQRVVDETDSLVVALPTSSGKTRIAELCILKCLAGGRRVVYVTPLRALSAQVEVTLGRTFKPLGFSVSSVYGASGIGASDVDTMKAASIVVATPEKLDFAIRQDPEVIDDVGLIVLDEGHMIGLSEREIRYEVLVQRLLRRADSAQRRIVCLSAIFTEGEPFDAFTQWIRSDNDGEAIRSQWRPTRQRPATLEWQSSAGRLEYRIHGETVFIPRFIEQRPPKGRRRNPFPQNKNELIAATIDRFHQDGHSVLLYCPMRRSVEPAAESFLKLVTQGYCQSFLSTEAAQEIERALRIGEEWLGANHVAMRALCLGVAVHHAQLPRPFLAELESLLRRRLLTVAISSPTLAQGVDLSFGVLVFTSLWRNQKLLPAKEFANVIGRVGRAYVDLDGIFVLPVFEKDAKTTSKRLREFHELVRKARGRELESGLYLLISVCLWRLQRILGLDGQALNDYVLNQQTAIDGLTAGDNEDANQLEIILAELDAGILALVEDLECPPSEVATKLDDALKDSLWQRRLAIRPLEEQTSQVAVLHGRASHIWNRTTPPQRKGFFTATVGTESGLSIANQSAELEALLKAATEAIKAGQPDELVEACCGLAERLFVIYPFQPNMPSDWDDETWRAILEAWITGATLFRVTDAVGIAFVQEALVFRLVWAIEATRLVLASLQESEEEAAEDEELTYVAICMTYGVPSVAAARLLEAGLESRLLAVRLASELGLTFTTRDDLLQWLDQVGDSEPITLTDPERTAWQNFVQRNNREYEHWGRSTETYAFTCQDGANAPVGTDVRLIGNDEQSLNVYTPEFDPLGTVTLPTPAVTALTGAVTDDDQISISHFGPIEMPTWLQQILGTR